MTTKKCDVCEDEKNIQFQIGVGYGCGDCFHKCELCTSLTDWVSECTYCEKKVCSKCAYFCEMCDSSNYCICFRCAPNVPNYTTWVYGGYNVSCTDHYYQECSEALCAMGKCEMCGKHCVSVYERQTICRECNIIKNPSLLIERYEAQKVLIKHEQRIYKRVNRKMKALKEEEYKKCKGCKNLMSGNSYFSIGFYDYCQKCYNVCNTCKSIRKVTDMKICKLCEKYVCYFKNTDCHIEVDSDVYCLKCANNYRKLEYDKKRKRFLHFDNDIERNFELKKEILKRQKRSLDRIVKYFA